MGRLGGERTPAPGRTAAGAGGAGAAPPVPAAAAAPTVEVDLTEVAVRVRKKLSYGLLDWAVTDADATGALALLGTVPAELLPQELAMVGDDHLARLLDNLPDSARSGPVYQRLVQSAGEPGILAHSTDLLNRGLFDWAVTDTDGAQEHPPREAAAQRRPRRRTGLRDHRAPRGAAG